MTTRKDFGDGSNSGERLPRIRLRRPTASSSARVVRLTQQLLGSIPRRTGLRAEGSRLRGLERIVKGLGGAVLDTELGERIGGLALPGVVGPPVLVINQRLRGVARWLVLAHETAHLAAGECTLSSTFKQDGTVRRRAHILNYSTVSERRADLFALAVVLRDRELAPVLALEPTRRRRVAALAHAIRRVVPDWPSDRVEDRATLRLLLSEHGAGNGRRSMRDSFAE